MLHVDNTLNVLSLCSGGGGLDLGLGLALGSARTICWVEWEAFAASVLAKRMEEKQLASAPIWSDLRTFDGKPWRGVVDCLTAGYPCQPFSLAGRRRGSDDPRHLWPHVRRVVGEVEPSICFFENVSGHLSLGFGDVAADLEAMGYQVAAGLFTAEEVGASHKRERLFILAVADASRLAICNTEASRSDETREPVTGSSGEVGDTQCRRFQSGDEYREIAKESGSRCSSMAHANGRISGNGLVQSSGQQRFEPQDHGIGSQLANAHQPRSQGCGSDRRGSDQFAARSGRSTVERPFPPGPSDHDAWRTVPESLWPAQSKVRLLADGLAHDRARWLRLFGNGVVPLQAAYAFCSLWAALRF